MAGESESFERDLMLIAQLKGEIERSEAELQPLKDRLEERKIAVQQYMQSTKSKRTEPVQGYYVLRQERTDFRIEDEQQLAGYLEENQLHVPKSYDAVRLRAIAASRLKTDGEILPGLGVTTSEYVSVRKVEGK